MVKYAMHHTHLVTANPAKVVDFYTRVMGGTLKGEARLADNRKAWDIDLSGANIRVSDWTNACPALEGEYAAHKGRCNFGLHHLGITVSNLDEAYTELKANGARFIVEPKMTGPGSRVAFIIAPDNVLIELLERRE